LSSDLARLCHRLDLAPLTRISSRLARGKPGKSDLSPRGEKVRGAASCQ
jgi:hypothetical protein